MRYYVRRGKRGLALRQYQRCVEVLQRELGVGARRDHSKPVPSFMKTPGVKQA